MKSYQKFSLFSAFVTAIIIFCTSSISFAPVVSGFSWMSVAYHFCIFFWLGFFFSLSFKYLGENIFIAFIFSLTYAGLDELHQYFVPGRSCNFFDFGVDGLGILIGINNNSKNSDFNQETDVFANNIVDANSRFALDLYSKYRLKEDNLFFSSYSISSALAMTYEGAKGKTAEEMKIVLHLPNDTEKIHSDFININNQLNHENKLYNLSIANALWAQEDYPFLENYFRIVENTYGAKATNLNFKTDTENSRITINNWVEDKTNNKIKNLLPQGILTFDTKLVLTNVIYFKANWSNPFNADDTITEKFKINSEESVDTKMMHEQSFFNYGETNNLQILEMDYLGDWLSMIIILPKEIDSRSVEDSLSTLNLANWKREMKNREVLVTIPKFKFETKYFMARDLREMGMLDAFDPNMANFTGMWNKQNDENLYISEVIHQTFIEVAEAGTEAAAATAVIIAESAAGPIFIEPPKPKIFTADHPFIFIIQEKNTGNILFMGKLINPTK